MERGLGVFLLSLLLSAGRTGLLLQSRGDRTSLGQLALVHATIPVNESRVAS